MVNNAANCSNISGNEWCLHELVKKKQAFTVNYRDTFTLQPGGVGGGGWGRGRGITCKYCTCTLHGRPTNTSDLEGRLFNMSCYVLQQCVNHELVHNMQYACSYRLRQSP